MEKQVESDSASQHFCQIASANGEFTQYPIGPACPPRIPIAATLSEIPTGDYAQSRRHYLHENRHQAGNADHPQQVVLELRAALQVGAPVAGIHITDADKNRGAYECAP